jgi:hypothetical protein
MEGAHGTTLRERYGTGFNKGRVISANGLPLAFEVVDDRRRVPGKFILVDAPLGV